MKKQTEKASPIKETVAQGGPASEPKQNLEDELRWMRDRLNFHQEATNELRKELEQYRNVIFGHALTYLMTPRGATVPTDTLIGARNSFKTVVARIEAELEVRMERQ